MKIATAPVYTPPTPRGATPAPATHTPPGTSSNTGATGVDHADFTHMTRQDLFDWMNTQIKRGELSLDDSSGLLGMTMKVPVNGSASPLDDQAPVNFLQLAEDGIRWGHDRHDQGQVKTLQAALTIMRQHQGEPLRVDLVA